MASSVGSYPAMSGGLDSYGPQKRKCHHCGKINKHDALQCSSCGKRFREDYEEPDFGGHDVDLAAVLRRSLGNS